VTVASYAYDLHGNRLGVTRPGGVTTATYDHQDRLLTYGTATYSYTANGELSSSTGGGQTTTYAYDALGNLTAVDLAGGTAIEYVVDGNNRRVGRKVDGVLVQGWLHQDQLAPIAEVDENGNVAALFVYATRQNVPDTMIRGGVTYRLLTDHLGSVRLVVDAETGQIAQRLDYDAFGRVLTDTNPGFQPFGFAGGLYDPLTGLVRFGARDYDAEVGRWTAKDPIGFGGGYSNLYVYVGNSPVSFADPEGLDEGDNCDGGTCDYQSWLKSLFKKIASDEAKTLAKQLSQPRSFDVINGRPIQRSVLAPKRPTVSGGFVKVAGGVVGMGITVLQMTDCNTVQGILSLVRQGRGGLANKNADRLYRAINRY
jgi:RHS repeat-associated protein